MQVIETFYGYDEEASVDSDGSSLSFHTDKTPDTEPDEVSAEQNTILQTQFCLNQTCRHKHRGCFLQMTASGVCT